MAAALSMAQENPLVSDHAGWWRISGPITPPFPSEVKAADRPAVTKSVNQLLDIVRRMPEFAPAAGFQAMPYARVTPQEFGHATGEFIRVNLAPWERAGTTVAANERDTAASIEIRVNDLTMLAGSEIGDEWRDDQGAFLRNAPQAAGTMHGHAVYESGEQKWILILRSSAPLVAAVSRERYLTVKIRKMEARLAKMRKNRAAIPASVPASIVATVDEGIAQLAGWIDANRKQLGSMSADERKAAAFVESDREDQAAQFADGPENAITNFNPALMDARVGGVTAQMLAICISSDEEHWPGLAEKVVRELDWSVLEGFVRQQ